MVPHDRQGARPCGRSKVILCGNIVWKGGEPREEAMSNGVVMYINVYVHDQFDYFTLAYILLFSVSFLQAHLIMMSTCMEWTMTICEYLCTCMVLVCLAPELL